MDKKILSIYILEFCLSGTMLADDKADSIYCEWLE